MKRELKLVPIKGTNNDKAYIEFKEGERLAICQYCNQKSYSKETLAFYEAKPDKEVDSYYCGCRGWD